MADTKKQATDDVATPTATEVESEYSVAEFAAHATNIFGVMPECVIAAFRVAGKDKATKRDAEIIIKNFMKKEVK